MIIDNVQLHCGECDDCGDEAVIHLCNECFNFLLASYVKRETEQLHNHVVALERALEWLDAVLDFGHQDDPFFSEIDLAGKDEAFAYAYEVVCGRITGEETP